MGEKIGKFFDYERKILYIYAENEVVLFGVFFDREKENYFKVTLQKKDFSPQELAAHPTTKLIFENLVKNNVQ